MKFWDFIRLYRRNCCPKVTYREYDLDGNFISGSDMPKRIEFSFGPNGIVLTCTKSTTTFLDVHDITVGEDGTFRFKYPKVLYGNVEDVNVVMKPAF